MKILITGTAGFVGFHLCKALVSKHIIVGLDVINNYYDVSLKYGRLNECGIQPEAIKENLVIQSQKYPSYRFVKADLIDKVFINQLFSEEQFDLVINLAAQAGVRHSIDNPEAYIHSNMLGYFNVLEACRQFKVERFIYASSSSIYGNSDVVPFSENQQVDTPVSLYAATKKSNELMAHCYSHLYGLKTVGLRFFTVYGEWGRPDMAYFKFAERITSGQIIDVYNNGNLERDFTYIDDIVSGIIRIVENPKDDIYKVYNIGNSKPVNLLHFIETLEQELGIKALKEFKPMQPGDVYRTYADTSELTKDYGYKPSTPFKDGIRKFVQWFKNYNKIVGG